MEEVSGALSGSSEKRKQIQRKEGRRSRFHRDEWSSGAKLRVRVGEQAGHRLKRSERRVAVPTNKEERVSDVCELVSRQVTD